MVNSNTRTVGIVIAVLVLVGVIALARETESGKYTIEKQERLPATTTQIANHAPSDAPKLSAILLVNSRSCPCTLERCRNAEVLIGMIESDFENVVAFETVDWELQYDKAKALVNQFRVSTIPSLLVLDREGHLMWQCKDFSQEQVIYSKFRQLAGETPSTNKNN